MGTYILRRILMAIPVLLGILIVTFIIARAIPGDPCTAALGERATPAACEAFFEGLVLFVLLWSLRGRPYQKHRLWPHGSLVALFFISYGFLRFFIEYTREPDAHIGLIGPFSMGQILCSLMIAAGLLLWYQLVRAGQQK